jgi:hypothetical protein
MTDETPHSSMARTHAQARLLELAQLLREAGPIDPDTRERLTALVTELSQDLDRADLPPAEAAHLAEAIDLVVTSFKRSPEPESKPSVRVGLQGLVARAEAEAPVTTRFAEQLIDILANLGI